MKHMGYNETHSSTAERVMGVDRDKAPTPPLTLVNTENTRTNYPSIDGPIELCEPISKDSGQVLFYT